MADVAEILAHAQVFCVLAEPELRRIAKVTHAQRFRSGETLFRQDDRSEALYVITGGRVRLSARDVTGREKVLAFCGAGEVLGEMEILSGEARSATAVATTDGSLLRIDRSDFEHLLSSKAATTPLLRELLRVVAVRRSTTQRRIAEEASAARGGPRGRVTVVFSPRGGAGATTLATNLAVALAQRSPERTVLVDLDVVFSHAAMLLNLMPRTSLAAISTYALRQMDRESLDSYLMVHRASSLRVLTGALRPEEAELVTAEHARVVVDLLRNYFAHVVIDTGRSFSEVNLAAFELADEILLVCTPDRVGAHAALEARRVLFDLVHLPRERVRAVLNRTTPYRGHATGHFESEVPFGGEAPLRAALEGQPVVIGSPGSPVSRAVGQLADEVETRAREALALAQR